MLTLTKLTATALRVNNTQYIFPPRPQDAIPLDEARLFADMGWIAQLKYNDSRCLIKYKPGGIPEMWNRHAERFRTYNAPDWLLDQLAKLHNRLGLSKTDWSLLDGGLLDQKHSAIKDTIVIWDILVLDGLHLLGSTYEDRYNFLLNTLTGGVNHTVPWLYSHKSHGPLDFGVRLDDNVFMPRNYQGNRANYPDDHGHPNDGNPSGDAWQYLWDNLITVVNAPYTIGKPGDRNYVCHPVLEGLVFKKGSGKLEMGYKEKNNNKWQVRSRVATGRHAF
jgi:hypothetical protein